MKIQQTPDKIIINNSIVSALIVMIVLIVTGIALAVFGLIQSSMGMAAIGGVALIIGVIFAFTAKSSHVELNKSGPSTIRSRTIFKQGMAESFQISDVTLVELVVHESHDTSNSGGQSVSNNNLTSTIILVTKTGQRITLGSHTRSMALGGVIGAMIQDVPLKKQADQIANFIGVQVEVSGDIGAKQIAKDISQIGHKLFGGNTPETNSVPPQNTTPVAPQPQPLPQPQAQQSPTNNIPEPSQVDNNNDFTNPV